VSNLKWLERYSSQTPDELIFLEKEYRIDSLVLAFEQAIGQKAARDGDQSLSEVELTVLAVEALEREINNGGYSQFFCNTAEFAPVIVPSLVRIGCLRTAELTQKALDALRLPDLNVATIDATMAAANDQRDAVLSECGDSYFESPEPIEVLLFDFIKANRRAINL
jgi:hypothetical protein